MSQSNLLVEGHVTAAADDGTFEVQISKVRSGQLEVDRLIVTVKEQREDLRSGFLKFDWQKFLITLSYDQNDGYLIESAYGLLSPPDLIEQSPFPTPIIGDSESNPSHARTLAPGDEEQEIVELTNVERWNNGMLPPYKQVSELHDAADGHSIRMAQLDFFAHCDLYSNKSPFQRMTEAGYNWNNAGENIAAGYSDVPTAMVGWMNSSGHRSAILSTTYREVGAGFDPDSDNDVTHLEDTVTACAVGAPIGDLDRYYTQNFGRRGSVYPLVIEREIAQTTTQTVDLYIYGPGSATSMRFSNDGVSWSNWMNYLPDYTWQLLSGDGMKTVYSEVSTGSNGSGTVYSSSDMIELTNNCNPMTFSNETLSGTQTYQSCEIIANPNVTISGDIIFQAPNVTLDNNVEVPAGATLEIQNQ